MLVIVTAAIGVLAAVGAAVADVRELADAVDRRLLGADGAKCPIDKRVSPLLTTERAAAGSAATTLVAVAGVGTA
ncbi:hypothetical protein [Mycolicibacterium sp. P1-5]|uniref:hypothetical protein n=1 Tax=Mycolicibacterium sp. P1-5 TaxID=2024617 RepID=UPI0011EEFF74|nr:hypothetical protein [Mycolicibacterium sp. P1-5]KAA0111335.1 hypothetical protein CIW47_05320 [Mycolicibacterium sp. P1-5]